MFWVRRIFLFLVNNLFTFYVGLRGREWSLFPFLFLVVIEEWETVWAWKWWSSGDWLRGCYFNFSHAKHLTKIVHMKHIFILYICTQIKLKIILIKQIVMAQSREESEAQNISLLEGKISLFKHYIEPRPKS